MEEEEEEEVEVRVVSYRCHICQKCRAAGRAWEGGGGWRRVELRMEGVVTSLADVVHLGGANNIRCKTSHAPRRFYFLQTTWTTQLAALKKS